MGGNTRYGTGGDIGKHVLETGDMKDCWWGCSGRSLAHRKPFQQAERDGGGAA